MKSLNCAGPSLAGGSQFLILLLGIGILCRPCLEPEQKNIRGGEVIYNLLHIYNISVKLISLILIFFSRCFKQDEKIYSQLDMSLYLCYAILENVLGVVT